MCCINENEISETEITHDCKTIINKLTQLRNKGYLLLQCKKMKTTIIDLRCIN